MAHICHYNMDGIGGRRVPKACFRPGGGPSYAGSCRCGRLGFGAFHNMVHQPDDEIPIDDLGAVAGTEEGV
jgi:hypothetical protein